MVQLALLILFPFMMAFAASSDLFTMTIPNTLSVGLVAGFVVVAGLSGVGGGAILMHVAAGFLVLLVAFAMFAMGWIGGGDAKLAAASSLWLGFDLLPDYLLISAVAGGLLTVGLLGMRQLPLPAFAAGWPWLGRLHDHRTGIPYGIALAGAALALYPHSSVWTTAIGS